MADTILDEVLGLRPDFHQAPVGPRRQGSQRPGLQPDGVPARAGASMDAGLGRLSRPAPGGGEIEPGPRKAPGLAHSPMSRGLGDHG